VKALMGPRGLYDYLPRVILSALFGLIPLAITSASDWPQFQADASKTGFTKVEHFSYMVPKYSIDLSSGGDGTAFNMASPIVIGNTVYMGSDNGTETGISRKDGTLLWNMPSAGMIRGAPLLVNNEMLLASGSLDAYNAISDGTWQWKYSGSSANYGASPTLANLDGKHLVYLAATDGTIRCFSYEDGTTLWISSTAGPIWGSPAYSESTKKVYVGSYDHRVYAYDAKTGQEVWKTDVVDDDLGPIRAAIAVKGDRLYVATLEKGLYALKDMGASYQVVWSLPLTGSHTGSPAIVPATGTGNDKIYLANEDGMVFEVTDGLGITLWDYIGSRIDGSVAYSDGLLFVACEDGTLNVLYAKPYGLYQKQVFQVGAPLSSSPIVSRGSVYIYDGASKLRVYGNEVEAPDNLSAVAGPQEDILLSWTPEILAGLPVSGYNIYRSPVPDSGFTFIGYTEGGTYVSGNIETVTSVYTDSSLTASGTYYYAITAVNEMSGQPPLEESTYSDVAYAEITIPILPPSVPQNITALGGDGVVYLKWDRMAPREMAIYQNLYRGEAGGALILTRTISATATSYNDVRVENSIGYSYAISRVDIDGMESQLSIQVSATPMTQGWPQYHRDAVHGGFDGSVDLSLPLGKRWQVSLPGSLVEGANMGPIVVGGTIYIATTNGIITGIDAENGSVIWQNTTLSGNNVKSSLAYYSGRLFLSHSGGLTVFRTDTNTIERSIDSSIFGGGYYPSPIIFMGKLYTVVANANGYRVVSVDANPESASFGDLLWSYPVEGSWNAKSYASPAASGESLYVNTRSLIDTVQWRLSAETGSLINTKSWFIPASNTGISLSIDVGSQAQLVTGGYLVALNLSNDQSLWSQPNSAPLLPPVVVAGTVYIGTTSGVRAINIKSGITLWEITWPYEGKLSGPNRPLGLVAGNNRIYAYCLNRFLYTMDPSTGVILDAAFRPDIFYDYEGKHVQYPTNTYGIALQKHGIVLTFANGTHDYFMLMGPVSPAPSNITAASGFDGVTITWDPAVPNKYPITGYRIFRSDYPDVDGEAIADIDSGAASVYVDVSPPRGILYYYQVAAVDSGGALGRLSVSVPGKIFKPADIVVRIDNPQQGMTYCFDGSPSIYVTGTATSGNFVRYRLELIEGGNTSLIKESTDPIIDGLLGIADITTGGMVTIRLTVYDETGQENSSEVAINVPIKNLTANIIWPSDGQIIPSDCGSAFFTVTLTGIVTGNNFSKYSLELARLSAPLTILSSSEFTDPVDVGGRLGMVTLPDCDSFIIRVVARDTCDRTVTSNITMELQGIDKFLVSIYTFSARGKDPGEHRKPSDVAVDREDYVWVVDTQNRRVQKYTAKGLFLFEKGVDDGLPFKEPIAAAVDTQNRILVLDRKDGELFRLDVNGNLLEMIRGGFKRPDGLWLDGQDRIYVANTLDDEIIILDGNGNNLFSIGSKGNLPGGFRHPSGVSIDPVTGNIIVADTLNNRLQVFSPSGTLIEAFGASGSGEGEFAHPYEAITGNTHNMFISDMLNNRVTWEIFGGDRQNFLTELPPAGATLFNQPHGLAMNNGESVLYIADTGNDRIVGVKIRSLMVDSIMPNALITSPKASATVFGVVDIRGIAADAYISQYRLEYGKGEAPDTFLPIAISNEPIWSGSLGLWDTSTLTTGTYTLRLTVTDKSGNVSQASCLVFVKANAPTLVAGLSVFPQTLVSGNGGAIITYRLNSKADVQLMVANKNTGQRVWMAGNGQSTEAGVGEHTVNWDGLDERGQPVQTGTYTVVLAADDGTISQRRIADFTAIDSSESLARGGSGPAIATGMASGGSQGSQPAPAVVPSGGTSGAPSSGSTPAPVTNDTSAPSGGSSSPGGTSSSSTSGGSTSGTHDNGMGNGANPKSFVRGSNPGKHNGNQ